jgi:hypothetical protein
MERETLTIKVEGKDPKQLLRRALIQLIHFGIKEGTIYYTGNWHEPASDEDKSYGRYNGITHRHDCGVERELLHILTKWQDHLFEFTKDDGELWATGVQPIVKTLGSYEHEWFDEEDGLEDKVVDLTVHSKFAKYK